MNKNYRHGQILKIVRARRVHTQQELAAALGALDVEATQVTLSRDIRALGLVKTTNGYAVPSTVAPHGPDLSTVAREFLQDVRVAQHTLVLMTSPAHASSLAEALDQAEWPEVVGTIAGDNTVLVIASDAKTAQRLRTRLLALLS
ncbi:MAG: ArgR family transcriptional regulator [Acidobacteriota bacterium]